jgi:branched-subunit amino acid permease
MNTSARIWEAGQTGPGTRVFVIGFIRVSTAFLPVLTGMYPVAFCRCLREFAQSITEARRSIYGNTLDEFLEGWSEG